MSTFYEDSHLSLLETLSIQSVLDWTFLSFMIVQKQNCSHCIRAIVPIYQTFLSETMCWTGYFVNDWTHISEDNSRINARAYVIVSVNRSYLSIILFIERLLDSILFVPRLIFRDNYSY